MFTIGCHLSVAKGYLAIGEEAVSIGANTFQFFTRNPRGGKAKALDMDDVQAYLDFAGENGIVKILAHAPYTLNLCSKDKELRAFAKEMMKEDIQRIDLFKDCMYNFHPGSHVKQGVDVGIDYIAEGLNEILLSDQKTIVLLETMAGKGTEIGRSFEELKEIIDKVELNEKLGICLDTCHVHDAGYDIINHLDDVLHEFDSVIGLGRLKAIHLNDSMNEMGSHKDRHAKIGEGKIGVEAFSHIINHEKLKEIPFYLETPNDVAGYQEEIAVLKSMYC